VVKYARITIMNEMHETNRRYWDTSAPDWQKLDEEDWRKCPEQPSIAFEGAMLEMINEYPGDMRGKRVCIIGSGDNYAAFALAGMGAAVTSTDISEKRLKIAEQRARTLSLDIQFIRCDASDLSPISDGGFDFVCSTPGTFVWISDLGKVYTEVNRVLRPGGYFIFREIHPFTRPWKDQPEFEIEQPYFQTGPFESEDSSQTTYEFYWTISDFINSLVNSGLVIRRISEEPAEKPSYWEGVYYGKGGDESLLDWHVNPRAALPQWLTVATQKPMG